MSEAITHLTDWMQGNDWKNDSVAVIQDHYAETLEEYELDAEDLKRALGESLVLTLMGCAFEDFMTTRYADEENVVDAYLKSPDGRKRTDEEKRYLRAVRDSILSVYEVVEVDPGESVTLRDGVLGGKPVRVVEHTGSRQLEIGDWLAARLLDMGKDYRLSGASLLFAEGQQEELVRQLKEYVSEATKQARKRSKELVWAMDAPRQAMAVAAPMITSYWLRSNLERIGTMPRLRNTDGDDLALLSLFFDVPEESREEVQRRLDVATKLRKEADGWVWLDDDRSEEVSDETAPSVMATLYFEENTLVVEVDSERRSWYAQGYVMGVLDGIVGPPDVDETTPEEFLDQAAERGGIPLPEDADPQMREAAKCVMDAHYRKTLDEPIPMLGDRSPRELAASKQGREQVVEWLQYLEQHSLNEYDFGWMWDELGIERP